MPVEAMRLIFEKVVRTSQQFNSTTPLGIMEINGKFGHYMNPDTDTMWIGFAFGMRAYEEMLGISLTDEQVTEFLRVNAPSCNRTRSG